MTNRLGDKARLQHVQDAIHEIANMTEGYDEQKFVDDNKTRFACVFQLQVIGEACKHLSEEIKKEFSKINWNQITGLRNIIAHEYFGIDYPQLWSIINTDLPELKTIISEMINKIGR
jgi:uncharacterized protein with HEPN domain